MDFEIDCDLDTDEITDFLKNRLQDIKAINAKLEQSLNTRKNSLAKTDTKDRCDKNQIKFKSSGWKKIANNKFVLSYPIDNPADRRMRLINVLANWDSALTPLTYKFSAFSSYTGRTATDEFDHVAVVIELPVFIEQLSYVISGMVIVETDGSERVSLTMPVMELKACDLIARLVLVNDLKAFDYHYGSEDLLAYLLASETYVFDVILERANSVLWDALFEVNCYLKRVLRRSFFAHRISPVFDGSVATIEEDHPGGCTVCVYYRNEDALFGFIHHLHRNMSDAVLVPKMQASHSLSINGKDVKKMLCEEMESTKRLLDSGPDAPDLIKHKQDLCEMEIRTDILLKRAQENGTQIDFN